MDIAISKNKIPIRMTMERWLHVSTGHPEIAPYYDSILETIENPNIIYKGSESENIATKQIIYNEKPFFIVVVYKEVSDKDGFVITAFLTNKIEYLNKKEIIWKLQK
ncbi:MAG: hypothetical protein ABR597_09375 [Bacteroidales bacterium]